MLFGNPLIFLIKNISLSCTLYTNLHQFDPPLLDKITSASFVFMCEGIKSINFNLYVEALNLWPFSDTTNMPQWLSIQSVAQSHLPCHACLFPIMEVVFEPNDHFHHEENLQTNQLWWLYDIRSPHFLQTTLLPD